ncbi:MAG TPA: hypothetical protein VGG45_01565 [Terracidiphilus sp.]
MRLVLHIAAGKDGALTATLDSIDQGAYGIPVSAISLDGSKFNMTVDAVHGTYSGTVNKDATEIDGTCSQGQPLDLNFKRSATPLPPPPPPKPAAPTDIDGAWTGTLNTGATDLHVIFKIVNTQAGLTAQMQSPDQSPVWIPATSVTRVGATLIITISGIGASFRRHNRRRSRNHRRIVHARQRKASAGAEACQELGMLQRRRRRRIKCQNVHDVHHFMYAMVQYGLWKCRSRNSGRNSLISSIRPSQARKSGSATGAAGFGLCPRTLLRS